VDRQALAKLLISRAPSRRAATMARFPSLLDDELAHLLAERYRQAASSNPRQARGAAHTLDILAKRHPTPVTRAYADWTTGLATLQITGRPEEALALLDTATARFLLLHEQQTAATIQISKLSALILLGRYEETIIYGVTIRERLRARGDRSGMCQVAQNLGNLHLRRGAYELADQHYHEALELALATADSAMIACAEHGLANLMAIQQRPHQAKLHYERAMTHATVSGTAVTRPRSPAAWAL
jgi:tetratricopeptide (TPR) repeat protein